MVARYDPPPLSEVDETSKNTRPIVPGREEESRQNEWMISDSTHGCNKCVVKVGGARSSRFIGGEMAALITINTPHATLTRLADY